MPIAKEWIEGEIEKLGRELVTAENRKAAASIQLSRVRSEYAIARQEVEITSGLIRALRDELKFCDYDTEPKPQRGRKPKGGKS
ncbi:MAG: hypothetical protein LBJ90_01485 [Treponema sp.]|jgi:uncharacterized protein (DUF3084 family)|nr:hypothetical protein [Treponema sp.]